MNPDIIKKNVKKLKINIKKYPIKKIVTGFNVELEHGTKAGKFNITNNSPTKTLKITMAHLVENKNYYEILKKANL
jgi:hypothetical protein